MNPNSSYMFYDMRNLEEINLKDFDTSRVTTLESMFYHAGLKSLDLSNMNFSSVKNMEYFFQSCEKIEEADFSNIDLSSLDSMSR
jgi:surface protein